MCCQISRNVGGTIGFWMFSCAMAVASGSECKWQSSSKSDDTDGKVFCPLIPSERPKMATRVNKFKFRSGKAKRCLLQFTPASWSNINWLERTKPFGRMCALFVLMMLWQMVELNTFFAKHFFRYPGHNWLCWGRILFLGLGSMPAIKQYYTYATDPRCKRLGNHAWIGFSH